jgi:hypothetical protein
MSVEENIIMITEPRARMFAREPDVWANSQFDQRLVGVLARPIEIELNRRFEETMEAAKPAKWNI